MTIKGEQKSVLGVIPARGLSQRIPGKNVVDFCGKPMIAWTIEAAVAVVQFDRVIISTDDTGIAQTAQHYGLQVPFLRKQHYDHHSPVSQATIHALDQAEKHWSEKYDVIVQLMPNCPMRTSVDIENALHVFARRGGASQISVYKPPLVNTWWAMYFKSQTGELTSLFPQQRQMRSQDLPAVLYPTGSVWIAENECLKKNGSFYGSPLFGFELSWKSAFDIDTPEELELARYVAHYEGP